jgi:hypothetical protein
VNQAGALGSPAKRCAANAVSFEYCAFRLWRMNQPGRWHRLEGGRASKGAGIRVLRPPPSPDCSHRAGEPTWRVNPPGSRAPPRKRLGVTRCGSGPPLSSMEGAPPARQRAIKARAGSLPEDRYFHLPLATAHPVVGAALIRRYSSVRLRGGQLGRIPSVL